MRLAPIRPPEPTRSSARIDQTASSDLIHAADISRVRSVRTGSGKCDLALSTVLEREPQHTFFGPTVVLMPPPRAEAHIPPGVCNGENTHKAATCRGKPKTHKAATCRGKPKTRQHPVLGLGSRVGFSRRKSNCSYAVAGLRYRFGFRREDDGNESSDSARLHSSCWPGIDGAE